MRTHTVPRRGGGPDINYIVLDSVAALVWAAISRILRSTRSYRLPDIHTPTLLAFDLDPGEAMDVLACAQVSFLIKDVLDRLESAVLCQGVGIEGVYVPLHTPTTYAVTQAFARAIAELLEREHPTLVT